MRPCGAFVLRPFNICTTFCASGTRFATASISAARNSIFRIAAPLRAASAAPTCSSVTATSAEAASRAHQDSANPRQFIQAVVIRLALLQLRMNRFEHLVRFPCFSVATGLSSRASARTSSPTSAPSRCCVQFALHRQIKPFLRARLHLESHARAIAQNAHQTGSAGS